MVLSPTGRMLLLSFLAFLLLFGLFSEPSYGLDPEDLQIAESNATALTGIPGISNSLSAGLVILAALWGWRAIRQAGRKGVVWETGAQLAWSLFFGAAALAALTSIFFYMAPSLPLLWLTRLWICLAMMALWNGLMIERVDATIGLKAAPWFYLLALAAMVYWGWTEYLGAGDLRLYTACVVYPMMVLPMILSLFPLEAGGGGWLLSGWAFALVAKIFAALDAPLADWSHGWLTGHALAHIGQALALLCVARSLSARRADLPGS